MNIAEMYIVPMATPNGDKKRYLVELWPEDALALKEKVVPMRWNAVADRLQRYVPADHFMVSYCLSPKGWDPLEVVRLPS